MNTVRIFFTKTGEAAYISHLDLQRVMARALRRSGMPVWWSQGFNPHIYMSFALPLPLGQQSLCECVDVKSEAEPEACAAYGAVLDAALPGGISVTGVATPLHSAADIETAAYEFTWPGGTDVDALATWYNALPTAPVVRKTKRSEQSLDIKQFVQKLYKKTGTNVMELTLPAGGDKHINPGLVLGVLAEKPGYSDVLADICRVAIYCGDGARFA